MSRTLVAMATAVTRFCVLCEVRVLGDEALLGSLAKYGEERLLASSFIFVRPSVRQLGTTRCSFDEFS